MFIEFEDINWGAKTFRSNDVWFSHPGFLKLVKVEWKGLDGMNALDKLQKLKVPLKKWNKVFRNLNYNVWRFEEKIAIVNVRSEARSANKIDLASFNTLKCHLDSWFARRCCYMKQLSKDKLIKEGDRNFKYFHTMATVKSRRKQMLEIRNGRRIFQIPRSIKSEVRNFYKCLYKQKNVPLIHFQDSLVSKISEEDSELLESIPSDEVIKNVVWDCDSSKVPGPDGYNLNFIKKCWNLFSVDFLQCVGDFFNIGRLLKKANMTWVTLTPKFNEAKEIKDFRPISMIGCIYKVVVKVLANQLRKVMNGLVGETQTTFVQGHQILDGALIANEAMH